MDIPPPSYKVVLLGDSSVGKTSLVHRFTTDTFNAQVSNTIGAAFITKEHTCDGQTVKLEIWDTAGQERYRSLTPMYYRNAKVALVCYDMSSSDSLVPAKYWVEQLNLYNASAGDLLIRLVGTKSDLYEETTSRSEEVRAFCSTHGLPEPVYTCAKTGQGVQELFDSITRGIDPAFFQEYYEKARNDPRIQMTRKTNSMCC